MARKILGSVLSSLLVLLQTYSPSGVHLTKIDAHRIALGQDYEPQVDVGVIHERAKRQVIANPQLFNPLVAPPSAPNALGTPFPTNIGFFPNIQGKPYKDKCPRDKVEMEDGSCQYLMTQGSCNKNEEVVLDIDTGKGFCAERLCSPDRVFVHSTQLCHDPQDNSTCPPGRELFYSLHGTSVCACPEGYIETDDDLDDDVCEEILAPTMACNQLIPGTVRWLRDFNSMPECLSDPCGGANVQKTQNSLPFLPSDSGSCATWGKSEGVCPPKKFYALALEKLKGECSELDEAGYEIIEPDTLNFFKTEYGPLINPKDTPPIPKTPAETTKKDQQSPSTVGTVDQENHHRLSHAGGLDAQIELEGGTPTNIIDGNFGAHQININQKLPEVPTVLGPTSGAAHSKTKQSTPDSQVISVNMHLRKVGQEFQVDRIVQNGPLNNVGSSPIAPHSQSPQRFGQNSFQSNINSINQNDFNTNVGSTRFPAQGFNNNKHSNSPTQSQFQGSVNTGFPQSGFSNQDQGQFNQISNPQMLPPQNLGHQAQQFHPHANTFSNYQPNQFSYQQSFQPNQGSQTNQASSGVYSQGYTPNNFPRPIVQSNFQNQGISSNQIPQPQSVSQQNFQSNNYPHPHRVQPQYLNNQQSQYPQKFVNNQGANYNYQQSFSQPRPHLLDPYPNQEYQQPQYSSNQGYQQPEYNSNQAYQQPEYNSNQAYQQPEYNSNQAYQPQSTNQYNSPEIFDPYAPVSIETSMGNQQGYINGRNYNGQQSYQGSHIPQQASVNSFEVTESYGMRVGRSLGVKPPIRAILKAHVTILPSGKRVFHRIPHPRRIRSVLDEEELCSLDESPLNAKPPTGKQEVLSRKKRRSLFFASPSNVFETRLLGCRPGAVRDMNAKCRNTVLPAQRTRRRGIRASPPVPPSPSCPSGHARDIRRRCVPRTTARNSIFANNLG